MLIDRRYRNRDNLNEIIYLINDFGTPFCFGIRLSNSGTSSVGIYKKSSSHKEVNLASSYQFDTISALFKRANLAKKTLNKKLKMNLKILAVALSIGKQLVIIFYKNTF